MLYSLAIHLYAWVVALIAPFHRKARRMRAGQRQTLPLLRRLTDPTARTIWFHAASLGEFEQGRPLMERIRARHPEYKILLTFFSPSGYEVRKDYAGADIVCYLPFDTPRRVHRFLDAARPSIAVFIKYEFWGNYLQELRRRQVPTYIVSAIFRPDQLFFQWYGAPYRQMLHCFTHLFVQDERSKALLATYGIAGNVTVAGDTRFDRVLEISREAKRVAEAEAFTAHAEQLTLVAGSTWPPDEELLLPYFNNHPEMKLIIAPHEIHEERLRAIESRLTRPALRLSQAVAADPSTVDCLIIDNYGLLSSLYRYGAVAYVGGGFGVGIHNTLEAAVYGVPVLFGPRYQKFKEAVGLIACGGGIALQDAAGLQAAMDRFLAHPEERAQRGTAARRFVEQAAGGTERILQEMGLS